MQISRFLCVVSAASLVSACALFQPIKERNAINDAETCIATEARVAARSTTPLEGAVNVTLSRCDIEIRASDAALLAQTQNDGRSVALKLGELHRSQRELARRVIALERAT